jgi:hypothetical protein
MTSSWNAPLPEIGAAQNERANAQAITLDTLVSDYFPFLRNINVFIRAYFSISLTFYQQDDLFS